LILLRDAQIHFVHQPRGVQHRHLRLTAEMVLGEAVEFGVDAREESIACAAFAAPGLFEQLGYFSHVRNLPDEPTVSPVSGRFDCIRGGYHIAPFFK
jgi:hypothetical protein